MSTKFKIGRPVPKGDGRKRKGKPGAKHPQAINLRLLHSHSNPGAVNRELPRLDVGRFLTCSSCGSSLTQTSIDELRACRVCFMPGPPLAPSVEQIELSTTQLNEAAGRIARPYNSRLGADWGCLEFERDDDEAKIAELGLWSGDDDWSRDDDD